MPHLIPLCWLVLSQEIPSSLYCMMMHVQQRLITLLRVVYDPERESIYKYINMDMIRCQFCLLFSRSMCRPTVGKQTKDNTHISILCNRLRRRWKSFPSSERFPVCLSFLIRIIFRHVNHNIKSKQHTPMETFHVLFFSIERE